MPVNAALQSSEHLHAELQSTLSAEFEAIEIVNDEVTVTLDAARLTKVMEQLHRIPKFKFEQLVDLAGVDYLEFGVDEWDTESVSSTGFSRGVEKTSFGRFTFDDAAEHGEMDQPRYAVIYHLLSVTHNHRLRVKVFCQDNNLPILPSVNNIWSSANWYEREAFDLYGIIFEGHPDLRRILSDYGFTGHPFRKDFPLIGHVEVRYDPEQKRVIYQPVSIEPRINVPKVIRDDHRFESGNAQVEENTDKTDV